MKQVSEDLENRFTYHPPNSDQIQAYETIRNTAKEFAYLLVEYCPQSRELSLALTHLEDVVYCANGSYSKA